MEDYSVTAPNCTQSETSVEDCHNNYNNNNSYANYSQYEDYYVDEATILFYFVLWQVVAPCLFAIITVIGTLGNVLVIYVIVSRKNMQTATNYLLLNLAFSDLAFLVICVPITAYRYAATTWTFGDTACKVIQYVIYVTAYVTVYTLVAVSLHRYITVVHSASTARMRTKKNVLIINLVIWILVMVVNIPTLLTHQKKVWNEHFAYCGMVEGSTKPFFMTFFIFGYQLPLVVISILYCVIVNHLFMASASTVGQTRQRTMRALRVIVLVVVVFALSWLPLHINQLLSSFGKVPNGDGYEVFRVLSQCMAYSNSCANPIIYNFVSKEFKRGFSEVICCKKRVLARKRTGTYQTENGLTTERTAMV